MHRNTVKVEEISGEKPNTVVRTLWKDHQLMQQIDKLDGDTYAGIPPISLDDEATGMGQRKYSPS